MKFKFLKHTADVKFQAFGNTLEEVFENSSLALVKIISDDKIDKRIKKKIEVKGKDYESSLYNFLEEFLFLFDSEKFILSNIEKLEIREKSGTYFINCECFGDNAENYEISEHIKAVTYNEMFVKKKENRWIVQVVLDV
jgi:SHS2 domain-containing protein